MIFPTPKFPIRRKRRDSNHQAQVLCILVKPVSCALMCNSTRLLWCRHRQCRAFAIGSARSLIQRTQTRGLCNLVHALDTPGDEQAGSLRGRSNRYPRGVFADDLLRSVRAVGEFAGGDVPEGSGGLSSMAPGSNGLVIKNPSELPQ
jgi:hypothetical protein